MIAKNRADISRDRHPLFGANEREKERQIVRKGREGREERERDLLRGERHAEMITSSRLDDNKTRCLERKRVPSPYRSSESQG